MDRLDVQVVTGDGCSLSALQEARLDQADLLLAVTNLDEVNMITALIAGSMFQVQKKVIRLRNPDHIQNLPELAKHWPGETTSINPDAVAAQRILALIRIPDAIDVAELLDGKIVVAGFRIDDDSRLVGKRLAELPEMFPDYRFLIPVIYRNREVVRISGDVTLEPRDIAYFSSIPAGIKHILRAMEQPIDRAPRVIIGGGGDIGKMVAREALLAGFHTTIIRRSRSEAEKIAIEHPDALVLHGDVLDDEILLEAGIEQATTFVAATNDQETNLLSSVIAKRAGTPRAIALVDNPVYVDVAETMGINAVVSPRLASVSAILRFVRGEHFEEVARLPEEKMEISVVELDENSPLVGRAIHTLGLPRGVIIAAVKTEEEVFVPTGMDVLPPGARAVLFTPAAVAEKVAAILEKH